MNLRTNQKIQDFSIIIQCFTGDFHFQKKWKQVVMSSSYLLQPTSNQPN